MGYDTKSLKVELDKNGKMLVSRKFIYLQVKNVLIFRLTSGNQELDVVELNVDKDENKTNVKTSVIRIMF